MFLLCVSILLLTHLPQRCQKAVKPGPFVLHKTPLLALAAYCGKEGPVNKIVRADHQGWSVEGGHREKRVR